MKLSELTEEVKSLNAEANAYNNLRNQKLGARDVAKQSYAKAVAQYKEKYGVDLEKVSLQEEYKRVFDAVLKQKSELQANIQSIKDGTFESKESNAEVEKKTSVSTAAVAAASAVAESGSAALSGSGSTSAPAASAAKGSPVSGSTSTAAGGASAGSGAVAGSTQAPVSGVAVSTSAPAASPTVPAASPSGVLDFSGVSDSDMAFLDGLAASEKPKSVKVENEEEEESFSPQGWGSSDKSLDLNADFQNLLGKGL